MGNHTSRSESATSSECFATMWLLSMSDFLRLDHMPSHEELHRKGLLVPRSRTHFCIFISHQWLGPNHPDPKLQQLPVLQNAFRKLISGEIKAMSDLSSQFVGDSCRLSQKECMNLKSGYIWLDWFCIPQKTFELPFEFDGSSDEDMAYMVKVVSLRSPRSRGSPSNQDLFISSIPFFVEVSDMFVALVPRLCHSSTSLQCNFKTYLTRGWCRLEMWCNMLAASSAPFLVVKGNDQVELANLTFLADHPPHEGEFTVESDRRVVYYVMQRALKASLRTLEKQQRWDLFRFTVARYETLLGLPPPKRDFKLFLRDFRFTSLESAKKIPGIGPWECAMLSGQVDMIPFLAGSGFEMSRVIHAKLNMKMMQGKRSPLDLALQLVWRNPDVALELLKFRADANRPNGFGIAPLGYCRTPGAVEMLVQHRADVNKRSGPLFMPPLSICCSSCAPSGVISKLLEHQAHVEFQSKGVGGSQPLACLAVFASSNPHCLESAKLLLDARSQIDSHYPATGFFKAMEMVARARVLGGSSSSLLKYITEWSTAPLGVACFFGDDEYVDFLLSAGADPDIPNARGHTPFQLANGENVLRVIEEFQEFSI